MWALGIMTSGSHESGSRKPHFLALQPENSLVVMSCCSAIQADAATCCLSPHCTGWLMGDVTDQESLSQQENDVRISVLLHAVVQLQRQNNEWERICQMHPADQETCQRQIWVARPGHLECSVVGAQQDQHPDVSSEVTDPKAWPGECL